MNASHHSCMTFQLDHADLFDVYVHIIKEKVLYVWNLGEFMDIMGSTVRNVLFNLSTNNK